LAYHGRKIDGIQGGAQKVKEVTAWMEKAA
jgi:hypothetical protein